MKRLILMRHAKSDWSLGQPDKERALNKRGVRSAKALGDWLRDKKYLPDRALVSSAARTRETWDLLDLKVPVEYEDALYHADADTMLDVLRSARKDCVLMLGHNPGICACAHRLLEVPPDHVRFEDYPTGATLVADFDIDDWSDLVESTGTARNFAIPRELI